MTDNRVFKRIACTGNVEIDEASNKAELLDLSLKGVLIATTTTNPLSIGNTHKLAIFLEGSDEPLSMDAEVSHIQNDRIGFICKHIDLDSISRLRRLVELNLGDPQELERELYAMIDSID